MGYSITCLELGAELAEVAASNLARFPYVTVLQADFETWHPQNDSRFDLVFAATAWHWIDPDHRFALAHQRLSEGGHLAFWRATHVFPDDGDPFFLELQSIYDEVDDNSPDEIVWHRPGQLPDERAEIAASGCFSDIAVRQYDWETVHDAEGYIALISTFSGHIAMAPVKRERLFGEIRRRLAQRPDGLLRRHWGAALHVARRA
jgi:SAM-dependent methyltransferase